MFTFVFGVLRVVNLPEEEGISIKLRKEAKEDVPAEKIFSSRGAFVRLVGVYSTYTNRNWLRPNGDAILSVSGEL